METIQITTEYIKLDQLLKYAGIVESGAVAKHAIQEGNVKVNDIVCYQRGKKLYTGDRVSVKDFETVIIKDNSNC